MQFIYSDLNPFNPTEKPLLTDLESIYGSLFNIFSTRKGERLFLPGFGIDLEDELFELIDDVTAVGILRQVVNAVKEFEPRVFVDTSRTEVIPKPDDSEFELILAFEAQGVGAEGQTFEFRGTLSK